MGTNSGNKGNGGKEDTQPIKIPKCMDARQRSKPPGKRDRFLSWLDQRVESIRAGQEHRHSVVSAIAAQVLIQVRSVYLILRNGGNGGRGESP